MIFPLILAIISLHKKESDMVYNVVASATLQ